MDDSSITSFVNLQESEDSDGIQGETPCSGFSNLLLSWTDVSISNIKILNSCVGVNGASYDMLGKGSNAFDNSLKEIKRSYEISLNAGMGYFVGTVNVIHGEADHQAGTPESVYEEDMVQWQEDYDKEIKAIDHQQQPVVLIMSQFGNGCCYGQDTSQITLAQYRATKRNANIAIAAPKYFLEFANRGIYLTNIGEVKVGEYFAKAAYNIYFGNGCWKPVSPRRVLRNGKNIDIQFYVPKGPLCFDRTLVSDPNGFYGFEYSDTSNSAQISSVSLINPDTVRVVLDKIPVAESKSIAYAMHGTPNCNSGPYGGGMRGCLRDSDSVQSRYDGKPLYNWCVHFSEDVN